MIAFSVFAILLKISHWCSAHLIRKFVAKYSLRFDRFPRILTVMTVNISAGRRALNPFGERYPKFCSQWQGQISQRWETGPSFSVMVPNP